MATKSRITPDSNSPGNDARRLVLVTGAAGRLGTTFAQRARERYDLRLMTQPGEDRAGIEGCGELVEGELGDLEGLKRLCEGVDTVVHLAAHANPATPWSALLPNNIVGTYNLFVAAKSAGCRRVVFASTIHTVSGYAKDVQVKTSDPVNPGDLYGVTKVFGEALGRYMAEQEGLSCIAIRIGAAGPMEWAQRSRGVAMMDAFLSYDDLQQLLELAIDDEEIKFAIVHGISDNQFKRLDLSTTRELLGYAPKDDLVRAIPPFQDVDFTALSAHSVVDGYASGIREDL